MKLVEVLSTSGQIIVFYHFDPFLSSKRRSRICYTASVLYTKCSLLLFMQI